MTSPIDPAKVVRLSQAAMREAGAANALSDDLLHDFDIDQILYCSLMSEPMSEAAIEQLAQTAASLNRMDRITGLLMQADGVFVQLIEGPREAVNHLWTRILRDKRHRGVVQLYHRREVESRVCEGWEMRYVQRDDLRKIIHEAKEKDVQGRKTAWMPAIERMDFLLSNSDWGNFVQDLKSANA